VDATTFWSSWVWPALTAALGFVFSGLLIRQWLERHKPHQIAWFVGFAMYATAAVMEAWSEATGAWDPSMYRIYIVLAASLVGFLGLGSLYLVAGKHRCIGHAYLIWTVACLAAFLYGTMTATLDATKLVAGITVGGMPLGDARTFPRAWSLVFNIPGTALLIGTSAYSVVKFWPKRLFRYRAWANVLIIAGTLVIAGAGSLARAGRTVGLYPAEMIGAALLLWGFLKASTLEKGAELARAEREGKGPTS
jgi:hypothetical protein